MTQPTRIYKHSSAGTDWAALALGAGLGLTLALQLTTVRLSDFNTFYSLVVSLSRLTALVGTYFAVVGMIAIGAASVTVVGPLGWLCDAMATAVMVGGTNSVSWFGHNELQGYQVFGVTRHEESAWEI